MTDITYMCIQPEAATEQVKRNSLAELEKEERLLTGDYDQSFLSTLATQEELLSPNEEAYKQDLFSVE